MPDQYDNTEDDFDEVLPSDESMVMSRWQQRMRQKQEKASKSANIAAKAKTIRKWVRIAELLWPLAPFIAVAVGIIFIILFIIIGYYYMSQEGTLPAVLKGML